MFWRAFILYYLVTIISGQTKPYCFVPSGPNDTLPQPVTSSQIPPAGPPGTPGSNPGKVTCSKEDLCNLKSCLYGFENDQMSCTCKCFDPCGNKHCNESEECIVMPAPDNNFYGMCIQKKDVCPKLFCGTPGCKFGFEIDSNGCPTCECKDPCLNYGCPKNFTCQMRLSSEDLLKPFCVACPKLNCRKTGVCPYGLAKNEDGCDVCECHTCPCVNTCSSIYCSNYLALNSTTGCNNEHCFCETDPCSDKCASDEKCTVKYTKTSRIYGVCEKSVKCPDCSSKECQFGLDRDSNGCHFPNCSCFHPCMRMNCRANTYCAMSADDCKDKTNCMDAPMPYCQACPLLSDCPSNCRVGKDLNGCDVCQCQGCPNEDCWLICSFGNLKDPITGCELCECQLSPCLSYTCSSNEVCKAEKGSNGTYYARCMPTIPVEPCKEVDCGTNDCLMGFEKDTHGCTLPGCLCFDWCKNYDCPPGKVCKITKNDCINTTECRDIHLRYCEDISPPTTTPVIMCTTPICNNPCKLVSKPNLPCPVCECSSDISITPITTSTTPVIMCTIPICNDPCKIVSKPNHPCPVCECPADCQGSSCPSGQTCRMLSQTDCIPPCLTIPRCVQVQPSVCYESMDEGESCSDFPILQYHFNSTNQICQAFWFLGCRGNQNRFASISSCQSKCNPPLYDCPLFQCSIDCLHGYKVDGFGCHTCDCIDVCKDITCPSANQQCRIQSTACPSSSIGQTFISKSGVVMPYCRSNEVPKCICKPTSCQVTCPFGKIKDAAGCDTCECFDPCTSIECSMGQLCKIVEYQNCEDTTCSSTIWGSCMSAFLKRNIRMRINASYEIYVLGNLESLKTEVKGQLSSKYNVKRDSVSITKIEEGSIIMTANVLYENSDEYRKSDNQNNFTIVLGNQTYPASLLMSEDEKPSSKNNHPILTRGDIILITLLCIFIPIIIVVFIIITFYLCKRRKGSDRASMKSILNASSSESSGTFGVSRTHEQDKEIGSSTSIVGSTAKRPISFTEA